MFHLILSDVSRQESLHLIQLWVITALGALSLPRDDFRLLQTQCHRATETETESEKSSMVLILSDVPRQQSLQLIQLWVFTALGALSLPRVALVLLWAALGVFCACAGAGLGLLWAALRLLGPLLGMS